MSPDSYWKRPTETIGRVIFILMAILLLVMPGAGLSQKNPPQKRKNQDNVIDPAMIDSLRNELPGYLSALPTVAMREGDPTDMNMIALGRKLFFDKDLSRDRNINCGTCHDPQKNFTDGRVHSVSRREERERHTPTVLNVVYDNVFGWEGRATSLEEQVLVHLISPSGNYGDEKKVVRYVSESPDYREKFQEVFGQEPSIETVAVSISAFLKTLTTPDSRFDQYMKGNTDALTQEEKRGLILFVGKASCTQCHQGRNFTDNQFHNLGVGQEEGVPEDQGRYRVTRIEKDRYAFKTPGLRNISETGPFMHDGSIKTLREVIEFYDYGGGCGVEGISPKLQSLNLTDSEIDDLIAFLKTLSGKIPEIGQQDPKMPVEIGEE